METKLLPSNLIITTILIFNGIFFECIDRHFNENNGFSMVTYEKFGPLCDRTGSHFVIFCCF